MQQIALTSKEDHRAKVQSVLLFTDGLATRGTINLAGILKEMRLIQTQGIGSVEMPKASDDLMSAMMMHSGIRRSSVLVQRAFSWVADQRAVGKPFHGHYIDTAAAEQEMKERQSKSPSKQQPIQPPKLPSSPQWAEPRQPDNSAVWSPCYTAPPEVPHNVWRLWHRKSNNSHPMPDQRHVTFIPVRESMDYLANLK